MFVLYAREYLEYEYQTILNSPSPPPEYVHVFPGFPGY